MDVMQALFGQKNSAFMTAAGFSDSPHFFYSGFKPNGEWYQLYQIAFGGVPARPKGDGPDCHCLFPAIKSVPTESIELNFPVRLEIVSQLSLIRSNGMIMANGIGRTKRLLIVEELDSIEVAMHKKLITDSYRLASLVYMMIGGSQCLGA
jgi:N-methylhydantoinase B/oxoprolinase/acetone carboxylase alpha subunit